MNIWYNTDPKNWGLPAESYGYLYTPREAVGPFVGWYHPLFLYGGISVEQLW